MSRRGRPFFKMSGSGNDFVVFDAREEEAGRLADPAVMAELCAPHTGVGADGVVFVERPGGGDADLLMKYFNRDGSRAAMCGNAALCVASLAAQLGAAPAAGMRIQSDDGLLTARVAGGEPEVDLGPIRDVRAETEIALTPGERRVGFALVGVPHLIVLCDDALVVDLGVRGRELRRHPTLVGGANVNFVSRRRSGWRMRTFERGVESETLACGTGAVACALLLTLWGEADAAETAIETTSGSRLTVRLKPDGDLWLPSLRGEGRIVFHGELPG